MDKPKIIPHNPPFQQIFQPTRPAVSKTADLQTFQGLILSLQQFWAERGCVIMQPLDLEMGAGTFHPATFLRAIGPEAWNTA